MSDNPIALRSKKKLIDALGKLLSEEAYKDITITKLCQEAKLSRPAFYQNFDSAFLNIYPNFINEVNNLLAPDDPIETKDEHQLTRELRILALIRLGITDNKEIASILRASIATVYTYRSRLKARAKSKDTFEDDIKRIQSSH